jgi:multicomponent Na+:H+ antiporter subunit B
VTRILRTTARTVLPLIVLVAVALFLQGHNHPGGGFIGGVLTVTAFALVYISYGMAFLQEEVLDRARPSAVLPVEHGVADDYFRLFAVGLALAAGSGLVPVALGEPCMTQAVVVVHDVPLYGEVELASALAFDLGVYLVVVGALLTVISVVGTE